MKDSINAPALAAGKKNSGALLLLRFFFGVAILSVVVALFLPALKTKDGINRLPKGQLKADARTMLATVRYVFQMEANFDKPVPRVYASSPNYLQPADSHSFEGFTSISNQSTHFELFSNLPAQT